MNVGILVLGSTSTHECGSTGTRVLVLVLRSTSMHECGSTGTRVGVLVLFTYFWPTLKYLLSWGGQRHYNSWENSLLSLLENNHRNKVFLDWTSVIIRTNAIKALLQQCADYYFGIPVHKLLPRRTSTLLSWHSWLTSTPVRITAVCYYEGINTLIITLAYQYACFYSGILF
jgi:hypothetical protein